MSFVVIELNVPQLSIGTLNDKTQNPGNPHQAVNLLADLIGAIIAGAVDADVKVVVKDVSTTINTSGSGSTSQTYSLK